MDGPRKLEPLIAAPMLRAGAVCLMLVAVPILKAAAQESGAAPRRVTRSLIDPFDTSVHDELLRSRPSTSRRPGSDPAPRTARQMGAEPPGLEQLPAGLPLPEMPLSEMPQPIVPGIDPPDIVVGPGPHPPGGPLLTPDGHAAPLVEGDGLSSGGCADCGHSGCLGGAFCQGRLRAIGSGIGLGLGRFGFGGGQPLAPTGCGDPTCHGCGGGCSGMHWVEADYLLMLVQGMNAPPLITSSPVGTAQDLAGVLGQASTSIVLGNERLGEDVRSGFRLGFGEWFGAQRRFGVGIAYTYYGDVSYNYARQSGGDPILARPFFNVEPGRVGQDAELIAFPNVYSGNINVAYDSTLQGAELLGRWRFGPCGSCGVLLGGYRYLRFDEELTVTDFREALPGAPDPLTTGTTLAERDHFRTRNDFHGGVLGAGSQWRSCRWTCDMSLLIGLGSTRSRATIDGSTTVSVPVPGAATNVTTTDAGLLAQQIDNIGVYRDSGFSVVPELGLQLGYDLRPCLRATVGYRFLYWSRVARPGHLIDENLNLSQLDGPLNGVPSPSFAWNYSDVWAQGLSFGLDATF